MGVVDNVPVRAEKWFSDAFGPRPECHDFQSWKKSGFREWNEGFLRRIRRDGERITAGKNTIARRRKEESWQNSDFSSLGLSLLRKRAVERENGVRDSVSPIHLRTRRTTFHLNKLFSRSSLQPWLRRLRWSSESEGIPAEARLAASGIQVKFCTCFWFKGVKNKIIFIIKNLQN